MSAPLTPPADLAAEVVDFACSLYPAPAYDLPPPPALPGGDATRLVLAGGCFWGVQLVFQQVRGVRSVLCGYAGGTAATANYEAVCTGQTGHAEAVAIDFNPEEVMAGELLQVFFAVAHDPTHRNRQGPDMGTQYRSAVFYADTAQRELAAAYIRLLDDSHCLPQPVATTLEALTVFYPAEDYHQHYAVLHPAQPYVAHHDLPKVAALKHRLPGLCRQG